MPNTFFQFKQFRINQRQSGMKVTTDTCLFGAYVAREVQERKQEPSTMLDVGTGTGLLALMLAQVTSKAKIKGIDINRKTCDEARQNYAASPWTDRLSVINSSFQNFKTTDHFDLIICNPPFFSKNQKGQRLDKNQAIHNDHLTMEDLSLQINQMLADDGNAWVLYPEWEMKAFVRWMEKQGLHVQKLVAVRNKSKTAVFRIMACFSRAESTQNQNELLIRSNDGNYSEEFSHLLRPFYLDM